MRRGCGMLRATGHTIQALGGAAGALRPSALRLFG